MRGRREHFGHNKIRGSGSTRCKLCPHKPSGLIDTKTRRRPRLGMIIPERLDGT